MLANRIFKNKSFLIVIHRPPNQNSIGPVGRPCDIPSFLSLPLFPIAVRCLALCRHLSIFKNVAKLVFSDLVPPPPSRLHFWRILCLTFISEVIVLVLTEVDGFFRVARKPQLRLPSFHLVQVFYT